MKRLSSLIVATIAVAIMTGAVYAATTLSITNSMTIVAGATNLSFAAVGPIGTGFDCSTVAASAYSGTGSIAWGNVAQGVTVNSAICLQNNGAQHTLAFTTSGTWTAAYGTLTPTIGGLNANGQIVNGGTTTLVDFVVVASQNAPLGTVSFTETIA